MNVGEFLVRLAQGLILLLTLWKLIEWARRRGSARLDVALLLLTLAIGVGLNWVETDTGFDLGVLKHAIPMVVLLHPLLMLRLVDHFRTVPRWISGLVFTGIVTSWGLLLATPEPFATQGVVAVSVIFALSRLYGARALVAGARHAPNVVQRRMSLLGAGAIVVVLLASLQALTFAIGHIPYVTPLTQVGLLAAAVLYSLGLAPPPWLSRAWRQADVQQFLQATAGSAGEPTERTLRRLCDTARHAVGGQAVALARWNDKRKRLELELRGERALVGGPLPADGLVFDLVYDPVETPLLKAAKERGAKTLSGLAMLVYQAAESFRIWTGKNVPADQLLEAGRKALEAERECADARNAQRS